MSSSYVLERVQRIARPRSEVFAFFSDAANLERITPAFLNFKITSPLPIVMQPGALIDYRLSLYGVPLYWRTRIETYDPESSFTDVQLRGPYRRWHHLHEFVEKDGGTEMRDRVSYELPLGPLGAVARALFVRRSLERIFDHRRDVVGAVFGT
jgi:ligand-binding SRPBCC domain-containing protein